MERARGGWSALACAMVACTASCTFDTAGVGPGSSVTRRRDALVLVDGPADARLPHDGLVARADLPQRDAPLGDRRARDALAPDSSAPDLPADALSPDTLRPDTRPADTRPSDTLRPDTRPPTCNGQFGHIAGYVLCTANTTSCKFYFAANRSCDWACSSGGGSCLRAAAERNNTCQEDYETACGFVHSDGLCTCSR